MKNKRKFIIACIFLLIGLTLGYYILNNPISNSKISIEKVSHIKSQIPECNFGRCPIYYTFTVDKDLSVDESVVIVPTSMTQGGGKVEIIKNGKVIFESPEFMQIGVREADNGDGFVLSYSKKVNSSDDLTEIRYRYENGTFVQDNKPPSPNTFDAAIELIRKEGYTVFFADRPMYDPSGLNAFIGMCTGSADGHCYKAFFFYKGEYLGTDSFDSSIGIEQVWRDDKTIALYYRLYRKDDPLCCSTAGAALVRFQWDGTKLKALDPIPTSDWFADIHR